MEYAYQTTADGLQGKEADRPFNLSLDAALSTQDLPFRLQRLW
jgi:hypothetical protein